MKLKLALGVVVFLTGCDGAILRVGDPRSSVRIESCQIKVWLKAYINPWATGAGWIEPIVGPSAYAGKLAVVLNTVTPASGSPDRFLTDNRGHSANIQASSRMHSEATFNVPLSGSPQLAGSAHRTGWTVGIDRNGLANPDTDTDVCWAQAPTGGMSWSNPTVAGTTMFMYLSGAASNPCLSGAPMIDYDGKLSVTNRGTDVLVTFAGSVDEYPSFEMYASDGHRTVVIFQQPNSGNTPPNLIGGAIVNVIGSQKLCYHDQGGGG